MKTCYKCKTEKKLGAFHKDAKTATGLHSSCKPCNNSAAPLARVWATMRQRCRNGYKNGVQVCAEWEGSSSAFTDYALANGWQKGFHTHRIDNDGDYAPGNVAFLSPADHRQAHRNLNN